MLLVFPLCVLLVYVVLAAQYESWTLPLSVILIVPMTLLCAIAGVWLTGGDNNVFTQVSFLVLAGLACKNAILIVEFAKQREHEGESHVQAILDACRVRLRPVLMTSIAFIMGVVPLVFSTGAGAEIRQAMGIAVFAGMLGVTVFGLFFTPVFYVIDCAGRRALLAPAGSAGGAAARRGGRGGTMTLTFASHWRSPRTRSGRRSWPSSRGARRARIARPRRAGRTGERAIRRYVAQPYDPRWWRQFDDPGPRPAGDQARSASNLDVQIAVARVRQARAVFDDVALDRYPVAASRRVGRSPQQAIPGFTDEPVTTSTYRAGFDAFWEIDLFGRDPIGDAGRLGQRRQPERRRSTTCGSAWPRRWRATTSSCAACSSSSRSPSAAWPTSARRCG